MTITEFLLARIEEEGTAARECLEYAMTRYEGDDLVFMQQDMGMEGANDGSMLVGVPRVLADCKAKRDALDVARLYGCGSALAAVLSRPYASHPDFDPAWNDTTCQES